MKACSIDGCERPLIARGWCARHYQRWQKHGDPTALVVNPQEKLDWVRAAACIQVDLCVDWPWSPNAWGYGKITQHNKSVAIHRMVCEMVHGPCPPGMEAAHSCGRPICASGRHLRWATPKGNCADRIIHGTAARGERGGQSKLTTAEVLEIRALSGSLPGRELARRFGVTQATISKIVTRRTWSHV